LLGGQQERVRRYHRELSPDLVKRAENSEIDLVRFQWLRERHVKIPAFREILENQRIIERFKVDEGQRKKALGILSLYDKALEARYNILSGSRPVTAREFIPLLEFAREGLDASMAAFRNKPEFRESFETSKQGLDIVGGLLRQFTEAPEKPMPSPHKEILGGPIVEKTISLGQGGFWNLCMENSLGKLIQYAEKNLAGEVTVAFNMPFKPRTTTKPD
jgi:hypothetical protein